MNKSEMRNGSDLGARHRRTALVCVAVAAAMLSLAFASVPLYRLFCQVTGFAGTTQRATKPADSVLERTITVRLDANVAPGLDWRFEPVEATHTARIGETALVVYRATNTSDRALKGTATYNVTPEEAGAYFNKLQCFCFTEQLLQPGQSVEMPVSFFIDPAIVTDRSARQIGYITLSYTFYPVIEGRAAAADRANGPGRRGS